MAASDCDESRQDPFLPRQELLGQSLFSKYIREPEKINDLTKRHHHDDGTIEKREDPTILE